MVDDELSGGPGPKVGNDEDKACLDGVYDPWHRTKPSPMKRFLGRSESPFLLIGVSLIVVIVLFFIFVPRNNQDDIVRKLAFLEKSFVSLEDKLLRQEEKFAKMPASGDASGRLEKQVTACERAVDRFESVEASLTMRIERLSQEVEKLKGNMAHNDKKAAASPKISASGTDHPEKTDKTDKKAPTVAKAKSNPPAAQADKKNDASQKTDASQKSAAPAPQGKRTYHEVRAGETLYRISKQYSLTVDALRRLNKLSEKDAITPGQKLVVTGTGADSQ